MTSRFRCGGQTVRSIQGRQDPPPSTTEALRLFLVTATLADLTVALTGEVETAQASTTRSHQAGAGLLGGQRLDHRWLVGLGRQWERQ
jgi:hypothetical protein